MKSKIYTILLLAVLSSCTKAIIDENANSTTPINRTITYSSDVQNIMFNHCITCHGGNNPAAGLDLSTYNNVRFATENGNLVQRINSTLNPMPQSGLLPAESRRIVDKWIQDGYLEN